MTATPSETLPAAGVRWEASRPAAAPWIPLRVGGLRCDASPPAANAAVVNGALRWEASVRMGLVPERTAMAGVTFGSLITGNTFVLLSMVHLGGGEKLIICGVKGAHLVEFPEAVVETKSEEVEEFADGLPPSASPSTINSVKHNILQPRLCASAPESRATTVTSSDEAVEELGDVARVLALLATGVFATEP